MSVNVCKLVAALKWMVEKLKDEDLGEVMVEHLASL